MSPVVAYHHQRAHCQARGPEPILSRAHVHECIGPGHGYDEHLCACGDWFKVAPVVEVRTARVPDSAREGAHDFAVHLPGERDDCPGCVEGGEAS